MGKTERKKIAFLLVCVMLLGIFGNFFTVLAGAVDGNGNDVDSAVIEGAATPTSGPGVTTTPSASPGESPSASPGESPSASPGESPSASPMETPSASPGESPSASPMKTPTASPIETPSASPMKTPTASPMETPSASPMETPSASPMKTPTAPPTETPLPTALPEQSPTIEPTEKPMPEPSPLPDPVPKPVPKVEKTATIIIGKSLSFDKLIIGENNAWEKVIVQNPARYKKYFWIDNKKGKICTKKYFNVKIKKKIPIKVKFKDSDKLYPVTVKLRIPAPKVTIKTKKYNYWGIRGYDFIFHYRVSGAKKIQVRLVKGGNKAINRYLDKCISGRKSNKSSHIRFSNNALRNRGKKLRFRIVAYYGKKAQNKSEVLIKTKKVKLK